MSYQYQPLSAQQEHNEELETDYLARELGSMTQPGSSSTQMEPSPSITTQVQEMLTSLESLVSSPALENLMSTLPPEVSQILDTVIRQLPSEFDPTNLSSMMSSLMGDEISELMSEDQAAQLRSALENIPAILNKESAEASTQQD